ncbi:MAG TPA: hypothetical protein VFQ27_03160 [Xanthobacteraceae bacterium]|nr:hypothetical protein [Xanthobacteraceae bacterium]
MGECRDATLVEMLSDPIVVLLMAADGVDPDDLVSNLRATGERRAAQARGEDLTARDSDVVCANQE